MDKSWWIRDAKEKGTTVVMNIGFAKPIKVFKKYKDM